SNARVPARSTSTSSKPPSAAGRAGWARREPCTQRRVHVAERGRAITRLAKRPEALALQLRGRELLVALVLEERQEDRSVVAERHLRRLVEVAQLLVRPRGLGVMVRVARQANQR